MHTVEELLSDTSATQVTHQVMKNCDVRDVRLDLSSLQSLPTSHVFHHTHCVVKLQVKRWKSWDTHVAMLVLQ